MRKKVRRWRREQASAPCLYKHPTYSFPPEQKTKEPTIPPSGGLQRGRTGVNSELESMENEIVCEAGNGSISPILVDADATEERVDGMQQRAHEDTAVPKRESKEYLPSLRQSNVGAGNAVELENGCASPSDTASALLVLDEQEKSVSSQDVAEKGELSDSKHAHMNMALGLEEESTKGESPVKIEQCLGTKASSEDQHESSLVEGQSTALDSLENEPAQHTPLQHTAGRSERGASESFDPGECNTNKPQDQQHGPETSLTKREVTPEKSEEQNKDHSDGEELDEHVRGNVLDKPPAAAAVPDKALLMKEPSFSTPALGALIDADKENPSREQEGFGTLKDPEQHGNETPRVSKQETKKHLVNEVPSTESCVKQELDVEKPHVVEQGQPSEQSLDTAHSLSCMDIARDIGKERQDTTSTHNTEKEVAATSEVVTTGNLEKTKCEDGSGEVSEEGAQAAEARGGDSNAGEEKEIVGGGNGLQLNMGATSPSDSVALRNGFLKLSEEDFKKETNAKLYTYGTLVTCNTDEENAQDFCSERNPEASLVLVVSQQGDGASENMQPEDIECTNGREMIASQTKWWGCCGMLDLLQRKDE